MTTYDDPLQHAFAAVREVASPVLKRNIIPDDEVAIAPAVLQDVLRSIEVGEEIVENVAAFLPIEAQDA